MQMSPLITLVGRTVLAGPTVGSSPTRCPFIALSFASFHFPLPYSKKVLACFGGVVAGSSTQNPSNGQTEDFEFFWRFNHLSAVDRGYDTTVSLADDGEAELALPKLRTYLKFENVRKEHLHRILVWDDCSSDDGPRRYITPNAKWATEALIGRATFGYIAFDVERGNLVYLNDFWRVDHPEIQKEGDVYRELLEAEVRNIAKLGRASDVRSTIDDGQVRASVVVQRTRTQDSFESFMVPGLAVKPYVHYQLILETVGMPLNRFKSTRQLCEVIRDAVIGEGGSHASLYKLNMLIAHTNAYNNSQILHRDVSA